MAMHPVLLFSSPTPAGHTTHPPLKNNWGKPCHDWMNATSRGHVRSPRGFQKSHLPLTPSFFVGVLQVSAVTNFWLIPKVIPGLLAQ